MADFRFSNEHSFREVGNVIDVLRRPRLYIPTGIDYPDHERWLEETESQIASGEKRAMVGYMGQRPVGAVVYRRHKQDPSILEIRNISVIPDASRRYFGSFLLRNSEVEGTQDFPGTARVMVDTKARNIDMIRFLENHGYGLQEILDLYGLGAGLDAVLVKPV